MRRYEELTPEERREYGFIKVSELQIKRLNPAAQQMLAKNSGTDMLRGTFIPIEPKPIKQ